MPADLVTRLLLQNKEFDRKIEESRQQVKAFEKRMNMAATSVKSFVGGFAGMAGVSFALMDVAQRSMKFEKSLSSLKALTGASAKEIEYYKQEAIKLGSTSTQTASQVVEAFQLIGSQNPELLKSKESLSEMTKQAIILAEAAGMDVPEAAKALSGSINQMGESTDKAGEYINILAAASQNGSADIRYLATAIEKSGGAASSVGVKYNELVASIEAIAPKITDASQAGTNLRNIFLTLESSSDKKLKPSVVGLTEALKNLAAKNLDATQMTKMFGKENVTAALAIVNAKDDYLKYIEAITGTNTALEQQKINNDNLSGAVNNLSSAWEGFILTINKSNGILKDTFNLLASGISKATSLFEGYQQRENRIISEGVRDRKSELEKDLKMWESYGFSRKEAIDKVRESLQGYYNSSEDIEGLKEEEKKLNELTKKYESLKQENKLNINPVKIAMRQNMIGNAIVNSGKADVLLNRANVNINPNLEAELVNLKRKIEAQRELVTQKKLENELYSQSVKYLDGQASKLESINKEEQENIKGLGEAYKKELEAPEGSIEKLNQMISEWRTKLNKGTTDEARNEAYKMIRDLESRVINMKVQYEVNWKYGSREEALSKPMEQKEPPKLEAPINLPSSVSLNKDLKSIIENMDLAALTSYDKGMSEIQDTIYGVGNAYSSLSLIMKGQAKDWFSWSGSVIQAVAQAIPSLRKLVNANESTAITGAAASAASTPIVGWITAISAVASIVGLFASMPKFANGGIVPGTMTVGDHVLARVNSGEMILNSAQQSNLFKMMNEGKTDGRDIRVTGELIGRGSNLIAVINNSNRKQNRTK